MSEPIDQGPVPAAVPPPVPRPPGVFPVPGSPSGLGLWDGTGWDPRPVARTWTRVWCNAIDYAIAFALWLILASFFLIPLAILSGPTTTGDGSDSLSNLVSLTTLGIAFLGYYTVNFKLWGRTPGMRLGRLHVVRVSTGGGPLSWSDAFLRALVLCLGYVCGVMVIVWLAITASSRTKQGPHDSAANTIVLVGDKPARSLPVPVASVSWATATPEAAQATQPTIPPSSGQPVAQSFATSTPAQSGVAPSAYPQPPSKRSRGPLIAGIVAAVVVIVVVGLAAVGLVVDSRIRANEMDQLLDATWSSEQALADYARDPQWEAINSELERVNQFKSLPQNMYDEAWATFIYGANGIATSHIGPMQSAALDVEGVSVLPWHRDIATARDAYLDHISTWLDAASLTAARTPEQKRFPGLKENLDAQITSTWVTAERRYRDVSFLWMPAEIAQRIDVIFSDLGQ